MTRNWANTYTYTAPRLVPVSDVDGVRALLAGGGRVRALGTRHSFTDIPDTTGTLVDVSGLTGLVDLDAETGRARVRAGTRYGELAPLLEDGGRALFNMGSLPHINVAGSTATGTHGSGDRNGVLTTAVAALTYVGADADLHRVGRGDPDFDALAVGLGAFGVIVEVELDTVPSFRVRQDVYEGVGWEAALGDLDAVTGAGYSVSIFTRWERDTLGYVWVKTRLESDDDPVPDVLLDGRIAHHSSPLGSGDNITTLGGVPGPWMLRLPHFRLDREPSFGEEIQTEYFVPRAHGAAALDAVRALGDSIRPHLAVSEIRTAAADGLWLSPASERASVILHFTWRNHPQEVAELLPRIEEALAPFEPRPHWGKVHAFDAERIAAVYPRLAEAREVFERLDPDARFTNAHLARLGIRSTP